MESRGICMLCPALPYTSHSAFGAVCALCSSPLPRDYHRWVHMAARSKSCILPMEPMQKIKREKSRPNSLLSWVTYWHGLPYTTQRWCVPVHILYSTYYCLAPVHLSTHLLLTKKAISSYFTYCVIVYNQSAKCALCSLWFHICYWYLHSNCKKLHPTTPTPSE